MLHKFSTQASSMFSSSAINLSLIQNNIKIHLTSPQIVFYFPVAEGNSTAYIKNRI